MYGHKVLASRARGEETKTTHFMSHKSVYAGHKTKAENGKKFKSTNQARFEF